MSLASERREAEQERANILKAQKALQKSGQKLTDPNAVVGRFTTPGGKTVTGNPGEGVYDMASLTKAAKNNPGGVNVTVDGRAMTYYAPEYRNNPGIPWTGGDQASGFADTAAFNALHPASDDLKTVGPLLVGGIAGAGALLGPSLAGGAAGSLGGAGGLSAETLASIPTYEGALASEFTPLLGGGAGAGGGGSLVSNALTGGAPGAGGGLSTLQGITAGGVTPWGAATSGLGVGVAGSAVGTVAQALGDSSQQTTGTTFGIPNNILGAALPAGLGYLGASSQADAMKDIYNQTRADRMPALTAYNTALQNPNTFYQSAPAMGAVDAVLRKLSVNGNPASNPGSLSQAAAYNLGGYNDYLRGLTPAAFGTANTEANIGMNQAGADAGKYNAVGYGLGQYFNPQPNLNDLLKNFSLNIGGVKA
jgi:hypothetical protein